MATEPEGRFRNSFYALERSMESNAMKSKKKSIHAERFFRRLPTLALAGDEQSVDRIAYELLNLLMNDVSADIGQLNLLPRGGRVEKVCIVKDGKPWLREDMGLHLYNPNLGFTGRVISTGQTLLVEDIWATEQNDVANPFLEISPYMDSRYVREIKEPVASTLILPIKRGNEIFCTIELSRYREKAPFNSTDQQPLDDFAVQYGPLIVNYIADTRNRIALNTAHYKLNILSRLIASNARLDYADAVAAYRTLSAADLGFGFFRRGSGYDSHALRLVAWHQDDVREIYFPEFKPSPDSVLCDNSEISYPVEGNGNSRRLKRFRARILNHECLKQSERKFLLGIIDKIRSYVIYPLHMLDQDLGAIHLASSRNAFCKFLHMSPFLTLYNALLKSFLLNERVAEHLSEISLKIHNPGFYCLAALKTALLKENPVLLTRSPINSALTGLDDLLSDLHEKGKILKCRQRNIHLQKWLRAYINQKRSSAPNLEINLEVLEGFPGNGHVRTNYEHLETIFENLFANSLRAITERQSQKPSMIGKIQITLTSKPEGLIIRFQDNGCPYKTVSGRGTPQMKAIMKELGGHFRRYYEPYRVFLTFPYLIIQDMEVHNEN